MGGNLAAHIVLLSWPVVTLALFLMLPTQRAVIWSVLGAYLFVPSSVGYDFPVIPTLDKTSVPSVAVFLLAFALARPGEFKWPKSNAVNILVFMYVFGPLFTGFANRDAITIGTYVMPGITLYASFSAIAERAIDMMPFILGVGFLRTERAHRDILVIFVVAALIYSLPIFYEIVKGPYLQMTLFQAGSVGFLLQQQRGGGFRSMVFLGHGLLVSTFLAMSLLAAVSLWREKRSVWGLPALVCALYVFGVLVLNKSVGALSLGIIAVILLVVCSPRRFIQIALIFALILVTYPIMRANRLVPVDAILSLSESASAERGESLGFRLRNEDILLNRARERPIFGWGAYGRNRVYVVQDWGPTADITITDGTWIIELGIYGWVGYLALFGLLCYSFWHVFRLRRQGISQATAGLAAMLLLNLVDLIPNASLKPITWMIAGALTGLVRIHRTRKTETEVDKVAEAQPARERALA